MANGLTLTAETATTPAVARTRGLRKAFGSHVVLENLDVEIGAGEFVALLGRSGSGKSTLLRSLAGLDRVNDGLVEVAGNASVAFQEPRLLPWRRVAHNVALALHEGSARERRARAAATLEEVGLTDKAEAWPVTLSGGQAQRASLARALVSAPDLFLLDEPFSALDALTRIEMHALVLRLWELHRPGILLVTHDVDEALLLADRIIVLDQGRVAFETTVDLPRPRQSRTNDLVPQRTALLHHLGVTTDQPHQEKAS